MKKSFLIISFLSLIVLSSFTILTPLRNSTMLAKVKSIREISYSILKSDSTISDKIPVSDNFTLFDTTHNKIKAYQYRNDTLFSYTIYKYNIENVLIQSEEYNSDGSLFLRINYYSNKKGVITKAIYQRTSQKRYDDRRNPVDVEFYKYYSDLFTKIIYETDFKGNVLQAIYFKPDNTLSFKYTYKHDYRYNKTEVKYYNNKGSVSWRKNISYNQKGLPISYKLYMNNRVALSAKISYTFNRFNDWTIRKETRKLYGNFFASDITDNTLITTRNIEYY